MYGVNNVHDYLDDRHARYYIDKNIFSKFLYSLM